MTSTYIAFLSIIPTVFSFPSLAPPVRCNGLVPKISRGEYLLHDNESYDLRFTTNVKLQMDLHNRSCFQVDVPNEQNLTTVSSFFYAVEYTEYKESYPGRYSYLFAFPQLQSDCRCDCPGGAEFCSNSYDRQECNRGSVCATKFFDNVWSEGCVNDGPARLCCEISVEPFQNRIFQAVRFGQPVPQVTLGITIYAMFQQSWAIFREYERQIFPYRGKYLHLNGYENVADIFVFADSNKARYGLRDEHYYFETKKPFRLLENPKLVNSLDERDVNKLGWLRYEDNKWTVENPQLYLHDIHRPVVLNCKEQKYVDQYSINSQLRRNSTGSIDSPPFLGFDVASRELFIQSIRLQKHGESELALLVNHDKSSAPTLKLDLNLKQKMSVISHIHASYVRNFFAKICLDKHSNRFVNVTLLQAYGNFLLQVFRSGSSRDIDVVFTISTRLPFSINYTDILPLPSHVRSARYVCLHPIRKPNTKLCKMAEFYAEPIPEVEMKRNFNESKALGSIEGNYLDKNAMIRSNRVPKLKPVFKSEIAKDEDQCSECEATVQALADILNNPNDEETVKKHLSEVCPYLSLFIRSSDCKRLVNSNFQAVLKTIAPMLKNPRDVCGTIYICDAAEEPGILHRSMFAVLRAHVIALKSGTGIQGAACEECQFVINEFKTLLADPSIQAKLKAEMKKICGFLKLFENECSALIDQYFPMILASLRSYLGNPKQVCTDIGLCSTFKPPASLTSVLEMQEAKSKPIETKRSYDRLTKDFNTLLQLQKETAPSPGGCIACMSIFMTAIDVLEYNKATQRAIVNDVIADCRGLLPVEIGKQAASFLDLYGTTALTMTMRQISAQKICQLLTACNKTSAEFLMQQSPAALGSIRCDACRGAAKFLEGELKSTELQSEIVDLLSEVCKAIPASDQSARGTCTSGIKANVPAYIYQLGAIMSTTDVCKDIKLCKD